MGLQDRDYHREKYQKAQKSPKLLVRNSRKNSTEMKYLLYSLILIAALWYGADNLLDKINELTLSPTPTIDSKAKPLVAKPLDLVSGGIILKTDHQGHFRGTALINNVPMPFMIDTGATKTSIPAKMAVVASLPLGNAVQTNTAGGKVVDRLTRINSLKIGNAEIRNVDANINQYLDEVLIGMNTLKYFQITQSGNTLTLVANNQLENNSPSIPAFNQSNNRMPIDTLTTVKKPLKKTITCDEQKVCKTTYSYGLTTHETE
jgi:aspartyl protease family protein